MPMPIPMPIPLNSIAYRPIAPGPATPSTPIAHAPITPITHTPLKLDDFGYPMTYDEKKKRGVFVVRPWMTDKELDEHNTQDDNI